jgi:acetyl-CoA C-acetyltransferase
MKKFIVQAKRTPIGKFLGSFYECNPLDVCCQLMNSTLFGFSKDDFQLGVFGNAIQADMGQGFQRAFCLSSGLPIGMPSYTINMVCGSGAQSVIAICQNIDLGLDLGVCGGYEFMSNIPYATNTYLRLGKKFGNFEMVDLMLKDGLIDSLNGEHMGLTAERIAKEFNITRDSQERYAFLAQQRALHAVDSGLFKEEIVPIKLQDYKKRDFFCEQDEFPNRECTLEKLRTLKPTFCLDGTITAGTASGINDGASFLVIASSSYVEEHNVKPLAEIVDYVSVGCDHEKMGLGPFFATKKLLEKTKLEFKQISLFEINEAFAAQVLGDFKLFEQEYGVDDDYLISRTNLLGSGLALGHPLGCTGARIITTLSHTMHRDGLSGKYGIATLCIGGGQGIAVLLKGC